MKSNVKIFSLTLVSIGFLNGVGGLTLSNSSSEQPRPESIKIAYASVPSTKKMLNEKIRLTIGEWPPYFSKDLDNYGLSSRIVSEAFALEGVKVEYGFFPWKRAFELAKNGNWDGSLGWFYTPERAQYFFYSAPITFSKHVFFHLKNFQFDWTTIKDLRNIKIGATVGYDYGAAFQEAELAGAITVIRAPSDKINFDKLLVGRIDIFSLDLYVGCDMLKKDFSKEQGQMLTYHTRPVRVDSSHLVLSNKIEKNKQMLLLFNQGLQQLRESGKLTDYLQEDLQQDCSENLGNK